MYWTMGIPLMGSISFGIALVWGKNRVPNPAAGMTALRIFFIAHPFFLLNLSAQNQYDKRLYTTSPT
jgi:hypothetical protein